MKTCPISIRAYIKNIPGRPRSSRMKKNMYTHSHQVDLDTLAKLYGLVQSNDSGEQSLVTKVLDEGSNIFLRKLLDDAADRIFEAHVLGALCTNNLEQQEDHLEVPNRDITSSHKSSTHKKVMEEKASRMDLPRMIDDTLERIESLLPELERLSKPYSTPLSSSLDTLASSDASSDASSYQSATLTNESDFKIAQYSDFDSSSRKQYGTSQSRITFQSSFDSASYHGDDELSPSEYSKSRHRFVGHRKMGDVNRLKDKSGSTFHHHHHYHHSHGKSVEASGSLWKKYGKLLRSKEKGVEAEVEKKMDMKRLNVESENVKRSTINKKMNHKEGSKKDRHFEELIGGLIRNLMDSKKLEKGVQGPQFKLQKRIQIACLT